MGWNPRVGHGGHRGQDGRGVRAAAGRAVRVVAGVVVVAEAVARGLVGDAEADRVDRRAVALRRHALVVGVLARLRVHGLVGLAVRHEDDHVRDPGPARGAQVVGRRQHRVTEVRLSAAQVVGGGHRPGRRARAGRARRRAHAGGAVQAADRLHELAGRVQGPVVVPVVAVQGDHVPHGAGVRVGLVDGVAAAVRQHRQADVLHARRVDLQDRVGRVLGLLQIGRAHRSRAVDHHHHVHRRGGLSAVAAARHARDRTGRPLVDPDHRREVEVHAVGGRQHDRVAQVTRVRVADVERLALFRRPAVGPGPRRRGSAGDVDVRAVGATVALRIGDHAREGHRHLSGRQLRIVRHRHVQRRLLRHRGRGSALDRQQIRAGQGPEVHGCLRDLAGVTDPGDVDREGDGGQQHDHQDGREDRNHALLPAQPSMGLLNRPRPRGPSASHCPSNLASVTAVSCSVWPIPTKLGSGVM